MSFLRYPPGMLPSQALTEMAEHARDCLRDDQGIYMDILDGEGFVRLLRELAARMRIVEQRASLRPLPRIEGNVTLLRPRGRQHKSRPDGDAA
ncbi:MAG TPA: hypothetical protein VM689_13515 [Aliidongia sp.]|nr:hypothetical protein [Aliidongia sp.]